MGGLVEHQYFFGPQQHEVPDYGLHAPTWADAERLIEQTLQPRDHEAPRSSQKAFIGT